MRWFNYDILGDGDTGYYCENCDNAFYELFEVALDAFHNGYACPYCKLPFGDVIELNEIWWPVQQYLLQDSQFDEGVGLVLPAYED